MFDRKICIERPLAKDTRLTTAVVNYNSRVRGASIRNLIINPKKYLITLRYKGLTVRKQITTHAPLREEL